MVTMIRLGLTTLRSYWKVILLMILFFAVNVFSYLLLGAYRGSATRLFQTVNQDYLIVHETDTEAEFYGSRVPESLGDLIRDMGYSEVVPVLHTATGVVGRNFQFIMGVDLERYRDVEEFKIIAGRSLAEGDDPRDAMMGRVVAERDNVEVGDSVLLRGRKFNVIGIFETRSFYDNDAWISISSAQELLGWGTDVSYFIIPEGGKLQAGDVLSGDTIVSQRGETVRYATLELYKTLDLFTLIVNLAALSTVFALGNVIYRLARIQQYHLAVLRAIGYSRFQTSISILVQAAFIFVSGFLVGMLLAFLFPLVYHFQLFDIIVNPEFEMLNIMRVFLILCGVALVSIAIPLIWVYRSNLSSLLRSE